MDLPKRKPNRLQGFDYSSPYAYFVTICTEKRKNTLCSIVGDGSPVPKPAGQIAVQMIRKIPSHFPSVRVEHAVVMPNHIHLLLLLNEQSGTGNPSPTLGDVVGWFKYQVTKQVNQAAQADGSRFFQRSFHDHIVRNEQDYLRIWTYIDNNPLLWEKDCFFCPDEHKTL